MSTPAQKYIRGRDLVFNLAGGPLPTTNVSCNLKANDAEYTNQTSNGFGEYEADIIEGDVSCSVVVPAAGLGTFAIGAIVAATVTPGALAPTAGQVLVLTASQKAGIKGGFSIDITGKFTGTITSPFIATS